MTKVEIPFTQFGVHLMVTDVELHSHRLEHAAHCMMLTLKARMASEQQPPWIYRTDSTWWQMFKRQYFPKWLLKRFPVNQTEHKVSLKTVYPYLRTSLPPKLHGPVLQVMIQDQPLGCFVEGTAAFTPMEERRYQTELFSKQRDSFCHYCHRPKLSDPAHEEVRMKPRRDGRVRCSAWLGDDQQHKT